MCKSPREIAIGASPLRNPTESELREFRKGMMTTDIQLLSNLYRSKILYPPRLQKTLQFLSREKKKIFMNKSTKIHPPCVIFQLPFHRAPRCTYSIDRMEDSSLRLLDEDETQSQNIEAETREREREEERSRKRKVEEGEGMSYLGLSRSLSDRLLVRLTRQCRGETGNYVWGSISGVALAESRRSPWRNSP